MNQEDRELLLNLLLKLDEDGLLNIYDNDENHYELNWAFIDGEELCIKINKQL